MVGLREIPAMDIKQTILFPFKIIDGLLDRIVALLCALLFAQVPQFIAQYTQRLGGHVDELTRIVGQYTQAAAEVGKSLEQFVATHLTSAVADFVNTGKIMDENISRLNMLTRALGELNTASAYNKFIVFLKDLDTGIFKNTFQNFIPGVPVTVEAIVYALIGLIVGMLIYHAIKWVMVVFYKKFILRS
jgi:Protein of unknown function (DUF2937).